MQFLPIFRTAQYYYPEYFPVSDLCRLHTDKWDVLETRNTPKKARPGTEYMQPDLVHSKASHFSRKNGHRQLFKVFLKYICRLG